jgi:hypothetical protein
VLKPPRQGSPHMLFGCMRVSTDGDRQVLDLQREALLAAGVDGGGGRDPDLSERRRD